MISLPLAVAISLAAALIGGAVAWGALSSTVKQLQELVAKVESKVDGLSRLEVGLTRLETTLEHGKERVIALEQWRAQFSANTGQHKVVT